MATQDPERLLGVREGFLRYFNEGLGRSAAVAVVGQSVDEPAMGLPVADVATVELARRQALGMRQQLGDAYQFYVGVQPGLETLEVAGVQHFFIRLWSVVLGSMGEAWGSSGALQLPPSLLQSLEANGGAAAIAGTRRQGGIINSLTGGLEGRRHAAAAATFHALCSLFYGVLQSRPAASRREREGV